MIEGMSKLGNVRFAGHSANQAGSLTLNIVLNPIKVYGSWNLLFFFIAFFEATLQVVPATAISIHKKSLTGAKEHTDKEHWANDITVPHMLLHALEQPFSIILTRGTLELF